MLGPPKNTFWTKGNPVVYTLENRHGTQKSRSSSNDDPFQLADVELFFLNFQLYKHTTFQDGSCFKAKVPYKLKSTGPGFSPWKKGRSPRARRNSKPKLEPPVISTFSKRVRGKKRYPYRWCSTCSFLFYVCVFFVLGWVENKSVKQLVTASQTGNKSWMFDQFDPLFAFRRLPNALRNQRSQCSKIIPCM